MAATITKGKTFAATEEVTNTKLHTLVDSATIANIDQTNMASSYGVVFRGTTAPSDTDALWVDTSASPPVPKFYDGSSWTSIRGGTISTNYREGLILTRSGAETLSVGLGDVEINGSIVSKAAATSLSLSTASDWAGGSSLQATNTTGYVGIDANGNIKLHTTAPTHSNAELTVTAGKKRYVSWSSVTYRVLSAFRMNGTGSGEINANDGIFNLPEFGIRNRVRIIDGSSSQIASATTIPFDDTTPQWSEGELLTPNSINFVPFFPNSKIRIKTWHCLGHSASANKAVAVFKDGAGGALGVSWTTTSAAQEHIPLPMDTEVDASDANHRTYDFRGGASAAGTLYINKQSTGDRFNSLTVSMIEIEELVEGD